MTRLSKPTQSMRRIVFITVMLALAAAACVCVGSTTAPPLQPVVTQPPANLPTPASNPEGPRPAELSPEQIDQIMRASVQIVAAQETGGGLESIWSGSGTIISPTGQIVTNCHVACGVPVLVILLTTNPDQPPEPTYIAEITHFNEDLDLAVLQITRDVDGNPVSPTNLPFLEIGDSNTLRLGDKLYIFGYPGVGGDTITFTTGSVAGFESATVGGSNQRVVIKTDADIAGGNSGGTAVDLFGRLVAIPTAVNPDVREGVTLGGIGMLRPVNLVSLVQQGGATAGGQGSVRPADDPDPNEPNDSYERATGPLAPGDLVTGYISWADDVDLFFITPGTTQPIMVQLQGPQGADYDLYLVDENQNILAESESDGPNENIEYAPLAAQTYWIAVVAYSGATPDVAYGLEVSFDGGTASGGTGDGKSGGGISISGQVIDGNTGRPLGGGVFGVLVPGVTCTAFFSSPTLDNSQVMAATETNSAGYFTLTGVPKGNTYSAFFLYEGIEPICEDNWLDVPSDAVDSDIGQIEITE